SGRHSRVGVALEVAFEPAVGGVVFTVEANALGPEVQRPVQAKGHMLGVVLSQPAQLLHLFHGAARKRHNRAGVRRGAAHPPWLNWFFVPSAHQSWFPAGTSPRDVPGWGPPRRQAARSQGRKGTGWRGTKDTGQAP